MKTFLFSITIVLCGLSVTAQPGGKNDWQNQMNARDGILKGRIFDTSTGGAMQFSSVAIYNQKDSSLVNGTISGPDGSFTIDELPYGKYYVIANFVGYEKNLQDDITITPRQRIVDIGDLGLRVSTQNLDEVEIVADQAHVQYKLDRKVINVGEDINASTGTAADVLQNTPSVTVDIDGNVSLRGSSSFTVLIDGKPTALSGSDALQQIPASAIRSIEIITNPSAKYDPDGMAGIINIISKKNALQGVSGIINASAGTGEKYNGDFLVNYRASKVNFFVGGSYRDENYGGSIYSEKILTNPESGIKSYDILEGDRDRSRLNREFKAGMDYNFDEYNSISFSGEIGSYESGNGGYQKQHIYDEPATFDEYMLSNNFSSRSGDYYSLNLNYNRNFDETGHTLTANVNYSFRDGTDSDSQIEYQTDGSFNVDTTLIPLRIRTGEIGTEHELRAQVDYTRPVGTDGKFEAGYQFRLDNEVESYLFEDYDPDPGVWVKNDMFSSSLDFYRNIQAVYSTFGNTIGKFQYQLGLRGEYTNREVQNAQSPEPTRINRFDLFPTAHISMPFGNNNQLMASYSRRIERPRGWFLEEFISYMNSTTLRKGNAGLLPEYMNSYELGYQKSFGKSFIAVESFYKNTVNKIERIQEIYNPEERIILMTFENVSKDHSLGSELMINFAQLKWLELNASTSIYRYWIEGEINGVSIDTRSNNWNLRLNTGINFSTKTRFQLTTMYNGPSVTAQGRRGAFFFTNAAVKQEFFDRKLSATLQLRDIFGTTRFSFESYGPNFASNAEFMRESRVLMLSLSYKINNYKQKRGNGEMNEGNGMGGDGDMF